MLLLRCVFSLLATVLQYCVVLLQVVLTVTYDIILLAVIVYCMWLWLWLWLFLIFIIFNLLFFTVGFLQWFFTGGLRCKNKFDLYFYSAFSLGACLKLALCFALC